VWGAKGPKPKSHSPAQEVEDERWRDAKKIKDNLTTQPPKIYLVNIILIPSTDGVPTAFSARVLRQNNCLSI